MSFISFMFLLSFRLHEHGKRKNIYQRTRLTRNIDGPVLLSRTITRDYGLISSYSSDILDSIVNMLLVCIGQQIWWNDVELLSQYLETSWFLGGEVCLRFPPAREALQFSKTELVKENISLFKENILIEKKNSDLGSSLLYLEIHFGTLSIKSY